MSLHETCAVCSQPVRPRDPYTKHQVLAWVKRRTGGGVNHAQGQQPTGAWRCGPCSSIARATNIHKTPSLFEEDGDE